MDVFKGDKIVIIGESMDCTDCLYVPLDARGVKVYEMDKKQERLEVYPFKLVKSIELTDWPDACNARDTIFFYERIN